MAELSVLVIFSMLFDLICLTRDLLHTIRNDISLRVKIPFVALFYFYSPALFFVTFLLTTVEIAYNNNYDRDDRGSKCSICTPYYKCFQCAQNSYK